MRKYLVVSIALLISLSFIACTDDTVSPNNLVKDSVATDYSQSIHWLSLPAVIKDVDVFYIYPTSWQKIDSTEPNICGIDNPLMLKYSKFAYSRQATAFETVGNIFAPYYRQDDAAYAITLSFEDQEKLVGGIPKMDIFAAFDYYIKHFNNGRPFILAGHSQGAIILRFLLSEYMKANPDVYKRMIAAYVIGYSVTDEYLAKNPHLKFAEGPDDTGVIISFNTESPDVVPFSSPVVLHGANVINPISWKRDETLATADQNLGSITLNIDGTVKDGIPNPVMNFADARIDKSKGVLICSTVDVSKWAPGNALFGRGVFHSLDYAFYYYNLRENAENRTKKYLVK